jgi:hypothetical protein
MTLHNRTIDVIAGELQAALRRETADILSIGRLLAEAKERVSHGRWLPWLRNEFSMSERSAQKYVKAADFVVKYELSADLNLSPSALFLLSQYDRREVTDAVIKAAKEKRLGCNQVKEIIHKTLAKLDVAHESKSEENTGGGASSRSGVSQRDEVVFRFTSAVVELDTVTKSRSADRFAKSLVESGILRRLGQLLTDLVALKLEGDTATSESNQDTALEKQP